MKKHLLFGVVIVGFLIVVLGLIKSIHKLQKELLIEKSGWKNNLSTENIIIVKGVIRTAGLSKDKKQELNLPDVNYQITNLEDNLNYNTYGYFLKSEKVGEFDGKCVRILGRSFSNGLVLIPDKIEKLEFRSCHPYYDVKNDGKTSIMGTIVRTSREISYDNNDYELVMDGTKPSDLGFEGAPENFKLFITPGNNDIWPQIENNINKKVVIVGEVNMSGYNKGRGLGHFNVKEVRPFVANRKVPESILPQQIVETYTIQGVEYALYQRGNMNIPMDGNKSGILISNKNEKMWREYIEVKNLSQQINNSYSFDYVNGKYYLLVVDAGGAGSGEGTAKLIAISKDNKSWSIQKCFYYGGQSSYDWSLREGKNIVNLVDEYLKKYQKEATTNDLQCKNIELILK